MTDALRSYVDGVWRNGVRMVTRTDPAHPSTVVAEVSLADAALAAAAVLAARKGTVQTYAAGGYHSIALLPDGTLRAWGYYTYDGDGNRRSKTVGGSTTSYIFDAGGGLPDFSTMARASTSGAWGSLTAWTARAWSSRRMSTLSSRCAR
jgi:hypothetical protein